jgi:drug/metabolite transporter (DMT)-like permease
VPTHPLHAWAVLLLAVLCIGAAAPLVRLAPDVPAIAAAFWRTGAVALLLAPGLRAPVLRQPKVWWPGLWGGFLLATHFWAWIESLHHTTILRSTLFVCLTPLWVGLFEWTFFRSRPPIRWWAGIGVALIGVVVLQDGQAAGQEPTLKGDLLATLGGVLSAAYLMVGRLVRPHVDIVPYGAMVFGATAMWLLPLAWVSETPLTGFKELSWAFLGLMALGPQLIGHLGLNWAVRWVPAPVVAALILLEPVGASFLGFLFLHELPSGGELLGSAVILVGVGLATWPTKPSSQTMESGS